MLAGIEQKWSSEIELFPVLVTHKRLVEVTHYPMNTNKHNVAWITPYKILYTTQRIYADHLSNWYSA